jgi:hypothetical protein
MRFVELLSLAMRCKREWQGKLVGKSLFGGRKNLPRKENAMVSIRTLLPSWNWMRDEAAYLEEKQLARNLRAEKRARALLKYLFCATKRATKFLFWLSKRTKGLIWRNSSVWAKLGRAGRVNSFCQLSFISFASFFFA